MNGKKCYLYLPDLLADWEICFITAELTSKRYLNESGRNLELIKIGSSMEPVMTMGGFGISPDRLVSQVNFQEGDLLILPGADSWMGDGNRMILKILSELIKQNVEIAAICGATVALAHRGILENRKHTSNDIEFLRMFSPGYSGNGNYINAPVVVDQNLITASSVAPLEFSYEVFKKLQVMNERTLEAWYKLYSTKDSKYFFSLMESISSE
jgi:putative intracellular protease/amidase